MVLDLVLSKRAKIRVIQIVNSQNKIIVSLGYLNSKLIFNTVPLIKQQEFQIKVLLSKLKIQNYVLFKSNYEKLSIEIRKLVECLINLLFGNDVDKKWIIKVQDFLHDNPFLTLFEKRVLKKVLEIPKGQVVSYYDLAKYFNTSPRRVANVMRKNPYPLLIPCHRVIYKDGRVGGYLGLKEGREIKAGILRREGIPIFNGKVPSNYFFKFSL